MSIIAHLLQITAEQVREFRTRPDAAYTLILGASKSEIADTSREVEAWKIRNAPALLQTILAGALENLDPVGKVAFEKAHREFSEIARRSILRAVSGLAQPRKSPKKPTGISLQKSWHGIHFLLTGKEQGGKPPLAWAVLGNHELRDAEKLMGYGPARMLTAAEVKRVSAALSKINLKSLRSRFDVEAMERAKVYAVTSNVDLEYFWAYLLVMKGYYAQASKLGKGMLCFLL